MRLSFRTAALHAWTHAGAAASNYRTYNSGLRTTFQPWPDELVLLRGVDGGKQSEVARQKVNVPLVHGDAVAVPDKVVNPVDLGAIFTTCHS